VKRHVFYDAEMTSVILVEPGTVSVISRNYRCVGRCSVVSNTKSIKTKVSVITYCDTEKLTSCSGHNRSSHPLILVAFRGFDMFMF